MNTEGWSDPMLVQSYECKHWPYFCTCHYLNKSHFRISGYNIIIAFRKSGQNVKKTSTYQNFPFKFGETMMCFRVFLATTTVFCNLHLKVDLACVCMKMKVCMLQSVCVCVRV